MDGVRLPVYWTEDELPAVLGDLAGAFKPRLFALCEVCRDRERILDARVYAWGLDFNRPAETESIGEDGEDIEEGRTESALDTEKQEKSAAGVTPGAVLFSDDDNSLLAQSRSAEQLLGTFSRIRDLRLVWV